VKDFAKKIKMEDARINLRKQQLEKIAQQKARALAQAQQKVETETKDVKMSDMPLESTATLTTITTPAPPVIVQPVPTMPTQNTLHPSLPLKPSSSPAPVQAASPSPAPAPAPASCSSRSYPNPDSTPSPINASSSSSSSHSAVHSPTGPNNSQTRRVKTPMELDRASDGSGSVFATFREDRARGYCAVGGRD
jgi:hypothetical protein